MFCSPDSLLALASFAAPVPSVAEHVRTPWTDGAPSAAPPRFRSLPCAFNIICWFIHYYNVWSCFAMHINI